MPRKTEFEIPDWLGTLAVLALDVEGKVVAANPRTGDWFASQGVAVAGQDFAGLFPEGERKSIAKSLRRAFNGETVSAEAELAMKGQQGTATVLLRFAPWTSEDGGRPSIIALVIETPELAQARRDIKNLLDRTKELEHLVITCPVTGIYNRRYFDLRYREELARAERYRHGLGIAVLDLDGFKPINDRYGHPVGDSVLKLTADTLRKSIRSCDVVARLGGDEFALLIPEITPEKLLPMAIRIRRSIQGNRAAASGGLVGVTASIGLACYVPDGETVDSQEPIRQADEALLRAKAEGGNRIILHGHQVE